MLQLPTLTLVDQTSGAVVGDQIRFANTALARLIGLLGAANLHGGEGLLLAPSSGVHTWGMAFPIDVIAMDRGWRVRRVWQQLPPQRILCPSPATRIILELPAGRAEELRLRAGDQLAFTLHS
jgi:uncharacterized membrane protein (UPF0127 family)